MAYCRLYKDYPMRVQKGPDGVVHAAKMAISGSFKRYGYSGYSPHLRPGQVEEVPETNYISTVCEDYRGDVVEYSNNLTVLEGNPSITCKNCLRKLGDADYQRSFKERFVVVDKNGMFLKRNVPQHEIGDATLYKIKGAAIKAASKRGYKNLDGRECDYHEWRVIPYAMRPEFEWVMKEGYSVKSVMLSLIESEEDENDASEKR